MGVSKNEKGLTLVELLAALLIFSLFIGIIGMFSGQVQSFLVGTKNKYIDKSDEHYIKMILQDQLADVVNISPDPVVEPITSLTFINTDSSCTQLILSSNMLSFSEDCTASTETYFTLEDVKLIKLEGTDTNQYRKLTIEFNDNKKIEHSFQLLSP